MNIKKFWDAVLRQDAEAIRKYFHPDAYVNWHNTNEHFTVPCTKLAYLWSQKPQLRSRWCAGR